jgi:aminopeptidase-like protein
MTPPPHPAGLGGEIHALVERLYPICRSITGDGLRETLRILGERLPLEVKEVPSGTKVFDWEVPREWNIRAASITRVGGERVVDFARSNLHVVGYSVPVRARMSLEELRPHLHSLPKHPEWLPYRTSYYMETWGFCLTHRTLESLEPGLYDVEIDATLEHGSMSYGELFLPGEEEGEVLISTHACHPSLCNDNLSGVAVAAFLGAHLLDRRPRLSYRLLFLPGTIGAIAWLALNEERAARIRHGLVLSCLGDAGRFTYKRSRRGDAPVDRASALVLAASGKEFRIREFSPYGYDERQYCSPGFNLPVGSLTRTPWGEFPEYHTSADDLGFVTPEALEESLGVCAGIVDVLEGDGAYVNTSPRCEPRLSSRGLWGPGRGEGGPGEANLAMLWVLNLSDGQHSLLEIAERSGIPFRTLVEAAGKLENAGLLKPRR